MRYEENEMKIIRKFKGEIRIQETIVSEHEYESRMLQLGTMPLEF